MEKEIKIGITITIDEEEINTPQNEEKDATSPDESLRRIWAELIEKQKESALLRLPDGRRGSI